MPRCITRQLRCMIWNNHALKIIPLQDLYHAKHVQVTFIDMCLLIMRYFTFHVPKVDIRDSTLLTVAIDGLINIAVGHLSKCSDAKLELICSAVVYVNEFLIQRRLINEPSLSADRG